jgi:hypothetical protein
MELGIFDHLDRREGPAGELYESRLRLLEKYDAAGFYSYHLAEHHATPLGLAPVPGIFLAAASQRTRRTSSPTTRRRRRDHSSSATGRSGSASRGGARCPGSGSRATS